MEEDSPETECQRWIVTTQDIGEWDSIAGVGDLGYPSFEYISKCEGYPGHKRMNHQQENISSGNMYYPLESLTTEETANANKGFDTANFGTDLYDMDTEVNYQELFSSQDQAVVSEVNTICQF